MEKYIDFIITYKNGKKEIEVVNGPDVNCSDVPTEEVVKKLMGEGVEVTDSARTDQYYDEKAKSAPPVQEESPESFIKRRDMDEPDHRQGISH